MWKEIDIIYKNMKEEETCEKNYSLRFKMSVTLAKIVCFKMNVTLYF